MKQLATILLLTLALAAFACDPGWRASYENRTANTAIIYFDGREEARLAPGETKQTTRYRFPDAVTYTLLDEQGTTIKSGTLDWKEVDRTVRLIIE